MTDIQDHWVFAWKSARLPTAKGARELRTRVPLNRSLWRTAPAATAGEKHGTVWPPGDKSAERPGGSEILVKTVPCEEQILLPGRELQHTEGRAVPLARPQDYVEFRLPAAWEVP